jgi:hypothetical protein
VVFQYLNGAGDLRRQPAIFLPVCYYRAQATQYMSPLQVYADS